MNFCHCNLSEPIVKALEEQGYTEPTAIQAGAIPPALEGRDVLGCARTGTGKTCAFAAPILQRLSQHPVQGRPIRALVLTPTRELAIQNQECLEAYGKYLPLKSLVIFGGVGQQPQVDSLKAGTDILVATPGRLSDLHDQGYINLDALKIFVLDEADRMLDMGFIHDVKKILKWLPKQKQTLFFSATMPPEITDLVSSLLHNPVRVAVDPVNTTVDAIAQSLYRVDRSNKSKLLIHLLADDRLTSVLVFTRTKHGANKVSRTLETAGIPSAAIHGNKSQTARQDALAGFKAGTIRVLVATDIAARGLDIENLSCVVNYNLPDVPETYVHRIGRTGRAGKGGVAVSLCDVNELPLLKEIEKFIGRNVPEVKDHPFPMVELESPPKDNQGRQRNPDDEEARAAAREKVKRRKAPKTEMEEISQREGKEIRSKNRKKQTKPADRIPEESPEKALGKAAKKEKKASMTEQTDAKAEKNRKRRKHQRAAQSHEEGTGVVPIPDLLPQRTEEPPAVEQKFDSSDILHRTYKRPVRKVIPSLANVSLEPMFELKESFGSSLRLDSDLSSFNPRRDATSRMFSTRKELPEHLRTGNSRKKPAIEESLWPESKQPERKERKKKNKERDRRRGFEKAASETAVQPKPAQASGTTSARPDKKGKKGKKGRPAPEGRQIKPVQAEGKASSSASKSAAKKRRRPSRPMPTAALPERQKDSTQQESLMKPYYLSDMEKK